MILEDALYPALFLKPDETVANALQLFRKAKRPMALVRDDDNKILGLITLEDILEEIVGDIEDEHDQPDPARGPAAGGCCRNRHARRRDRHARQDPLRRGVRTDRRHAELILEQPAEQARRRRAPMTAFGHQTVGTRVQLCPSLARLMPHSSSG